MNNKTIIIVFEFAPLVSRRVGNNLLDLHNSSDDNQFHPVIFHDDDGDNDDDNEGSLLNITLTRLQTGS